MTALAVEVEELTKRYEPGGVVALAGISFAVEEGEIFGYLGRNGAGKSTTVRILTTLLRPTSGVARVGGFDVTVEPAAVRRVLGAALQEAALDELMTGREHLVLGARLGGARRRAAKRRADELLELFGLRAAADRIAGSYSGGMRRRLDVAMAMLRRPRVLFLDEPTTGLDPQGRRALWTLIREVRDAGSTVFLTTQYLAEADELSGRVAVVHDGRIAAIGSPADLKARLGGATTVRLRVDPRQGRKLLAALRPGTGAHGEDGWFVVAVPEGESAVPPLLGRLAAAGVAVESLTIQSPTLEDVFVNLTGTEIESSAVPADAGSMAAIRRGMGGTPGARR